MKRSALVWVGLVAAAGTFAILRNPVVLAQMTSPAENKGVSAKVIGALHLALEFDRIENRQLRMRVVTLAPGGVFATHSHKDRPSLEYVLAGRNTTHWWRNDGTEPTVFVAVDVFNPPK